MPEFKVRYLVLLRNDMIKVSDKQTVVEKLTATTIEQARAKAKDLAEIRSKKTEKWILKAVEQV